MRFAYVPLHQVTSEGTLNSHMPPNIAGPIHTSSSICRERQMPGDSIEVRKWPVLPLAIQHNSLVIIDQDIC